MSFTVPATFSIFGHKYKVSMATFEAMDTDLGQCNYITKQIMLRRSTNTHPLARSEIEQTALHEITHAILREIGEGKLARNEALVDRFAQALHQVLVTSSGEAK
jgi:hypothetical protein